jgi:quercetin dioxygenase-like cupin family protein
MDFFYDVNELPLKPFAPGIRWFVFSLEKMMGAYFEIQPGVIVDEHSHPHEQMGMLIRGTLKWRVAGKETMTKAPALYRIPSQERHRAEIVGDEPALIFEIYHPIREDFLKEGPAKYMKGPTGE